MTFRFLLSKKSSPVQTIQLILATEKNQKVFAFRTSLKISAENWDTQKQRPLNIYLKHNKQLNSCLDRIKKVLSEYISEIELQKKQPQQRVMSLKIKQICSNIHYDNPENSLLGYMQRYMEVKKDIICHSTYKRYQVFYRLLERFEGFLCKRLYVEEINSDFIRDFIFFGRKEEYSENTIYRTIHFVKTILNFAERKGIRTCVRELEIRREKQRREIVTLTEREILQIKSTEVSQDLQSAKDWLLISCYTGQRFSDFINFDIQQLQTVDGKTCLSFIQQKTKKEIILPLHPTVINVIERNGNSFPKLMDIQTYNNNIKKIAKSSNLNMSIKARKRLGYRTKEVETEKWEVLSSHIGRRSFATNFYGKIPTPLLMDATGHSTEQMFLRYINPMDKDRILSLSNYFDRMYEERLDICNN